MLHAHLNVLFPAIYEASQGQELGGVRCANTAMRLEALLPKSLMGKRREVDQDGPNLVDAHVQVFSISRKYLAAEMMRCWSTIEDEHLAEELFNYLLKMSDAQTVLPKDLIELLRTEGGNAKNARYVGPIMSLESASDWCERDKIARALMNGWLKTMPFPRLIFLIRFSNLLPQGPLLTDTLKAQLCTQADLLEQQSRP